MLAILSFLAAGVWRNILIALLFFLAFVLAGNVITKYILKIALKMFTKKETEPDLHVLRALEPPLRFLFITLGIYLSLKFLPLSAALNVTVLKLFRMAIIVILAWVFYNLAGARLFVATSRSFDLEIDDILIPFLSKFTRVVIIVLAASIIAEEWGYNVSSFVAGLGLGGLAVALAAQDALGNIFGGIVIIMDKPFSIGERITTPSVDGTVEDISFRSTKVRTLTNAVVTVPNSTLANEPITNWAKMEKRRITFNLGINSEAPLEKFKNCLEKIRTMLENHPGIHKDTIHAVFDQFNEGRLEILFYFFTTTTDWGEYLKIKEEVNFNTLVILEEEGLSLAFPGRSIYLQNKDPEK
ncbi:MAG: mechanosensitive ion channel [Firmicutes bacterium]|nr:mechanosensitive ion channel [Bacillota bacterium]